ncbi:interleukin-17F-like [Acanthaster planci]|uniref:Interleukin-17F-like n=1 Tax=Acanthaster planci TaxID=133434 RepID=A0A8B7YBY4_ACAPL|nr:interleukin-17F-like [Acanthaster planci]
MTSSLKNVKKATLLSLLVTLLIVYGTVANPIGSSQVCPSSPLTLFGQDTSTLPQAAHQAPETNQTCPSGDRVQSHWPTSRSATCPWRYETDYDADRFPSTLTQAVCSCAQEGCLNPYTNEPEPDLECTPVMYSVPVMRRRDCVDGVADVYQDVESVTVACVCLRPVSHAIRAPGIIGLTD